MKQYSVYILQCYDGSYYVGVTSELEKRIEEHHSGFYTDCYTYSRRPLVVKHVEIYQRVYDAIEREKQIKGWGRKKKEALMNEHYDDLKMLSRSRNEPKP